MSIFLAVPDPHPGPADPDLDPFQPKVKLNYSFFTENFNILSKKLQIMKPMTLTEKINQCTQTGTAVKNIISNMCKSKTWGRIRIRKPIQHRKSGN